MPFITRAALAQVAFNRRLFQDHSYFQYLHFVNDNNDTSLNTSHNPEVELAFRFIRDTNRHIFLTGKAGTGKTTFLHRVRRDIIKRSLVVAPTGVAAINARGVTIHSLFQLPFGPLVPGVKRNESERRKFTKQKINLLRSLDLLIIDEISMVRADVLDAISEVLQRYRGIREPFGGVQLLMIGDLHQLPPVVKPDDWYTLRPHYNTTYFFGSQTLQHTAPVVIELKHIYRQSDSTFISLLNKVRNNQMDDNAIDMLNSRYNPNASSETSGAITLTSHVHAAQKINKEKLDLLGGTKYKFKADVDGTFPSHAFPNHEQLEFKIGAQVMFVKNDLSEDKLYYNGKIGQIVDIDEDIIRVQCEGEDHKIYVSKATWENTKYTLNEKTKVVNEEVVGTFTQYPLRLAWAITIHKSQGLTFDKINIDAADAFAHGQVYVALSRCRSLEGISLYSKIIKKSISTDDAIQSYESQAATNAPTESHLEQAQKDFQRYILRQLFDLSGLKYKMESLYKAITENSKSLHGNILEDIQNISTFANEQIIKVALKFNPRLEYYFKEDDLPSDNKELQSRLQGASTYFTKALRDTTLADLKKISIVTDNQEIKKRVTDRLSELKLEVISKIACFDSCKVDFDPQRYLTARANAAIDGATLKEKPSTELKNLRDLTHVKLYKRLTAWRKAKAAADEVPAYVIATTRTLLEICEVLPTTESALKLIHGVGKKRIEAVGDEILDIVVKYCEIEKTESDLIENASKEIKPEKEKKIPSSTISLKMYNKGMTIEQIAEERGLVTSTIESHLAKAIAAGKLDIHNFIEEEKVEAAIKYFEHAEDPSIKLALEKLGKDYSYGSLRMVLAHMERSS